MEFIYSDGGRQLAGFKGNTGDCVTRAIAIATQKPYHEVYDALNELSRDERPIKGKKSKSRMGVFRKTYESYLTANGWKWIPCMKIGQGCRVHLRKEELPNGRLIVSVSRHLTAVIDGVIHDNHDCARNGNRCVYGYYIKEN